MALLVCDILRQVFRNNGKSFIVSSSNERFCEQFRFFSSKNEHLSIVAHFVRSFPRLLFALNIFNHVEK